MPTPNHAELSGASVDDPVVKEECRPGPRSGNTNQKQLESSIAAGSDSSKPATLALTDIRIDGGTQLRYFVGSHWVEEYADAMAGGAEFPPVVVFFDGTEYWLADGFHRYDATARNELDEIAVEIHEGTCRDAVLYSASTNATHGIRRTPDDKRKTVLTLLEDDEWSKWSDREIARRCGVSKSFTNKMRSSLSTRDSDTPTTRTYTDKHGNESVMNIENIGKAPKPNREPPFVLPDIYADVRGVPDRKFHNVSLPVESAEASARLMCELFSDDYLDDLVKKIRRKVPPSYMTEKRQPVAPAKPVNIEKEILSVIRWVNSFKNSRERERLDFFIDHCEQLTEDEHDRLLDELQRAHREIGQHIDIMTGADADDIIDAEFAEVVEEGEVVNGGAS